MNEQELLVQYKTTGNIAILGKLYAPYMSLLYGVCYKYFEDSERSNDAVMQVFEELIVKLRKHDVTHFKSWLYVYVKNYCLMQLRKDKRHPHVGLDDHLLESEHSVSKAEEEPRWQEKDFVKLESCIQTLNEEQQRCIRMFYLEQKCYKDIAEHTRFDLNKVKSAIQNGKRNLKICMESKKNGK